MRFDNRSVLIVDEQEETSEVLRTILQRQGVQVHAARRASDGLKLARACRPDVIVLDVETDRTDVDALCQFDREARSQRTALVLLGTIARGTTPPLGAEVVRKPYHYGPLIRKIEEMLAGRKAA